MYESADVIAVSRVTFKNQGIQRLSNGSSVLRSQTLRDVYHSIEWPKLRFTKVRSLRLSSSFGAHVDEIAYK